MAYTTVADVRARHKMLASTTVIGDAAITAYIDDAGAQIDAYLAQRYAVPIAGPYDTPPTAWVGPTRVLWVIATKLAEAMSLQQLVNDSHYNWSERTIWSELKKEALDLLSRIVDEDLFAAVPGAADPVGGMESTALLGYTGGTAVPRMDLITAEIDRATGAPLTPYEADLLSRARP